MKPIRFRPARFPLAALLLFFTISCGEDGPLDPTEVSFHSDLGVDLDAMTRTDSGLYWQDEIEGEGATAQAGDDITVHFTGWLHDGRVFDTTEGHEPFTVTLGVGNLIPGWDEGVPGMREGGRRLLVVPPHLAYGAPGLPGVIPRHATLVFRVDLVAVRESEPES
jgi:FKBP-type peptidyl-prolyl cis-trans isomerase FkpA